MPSRVLGTIIDDFSYHKCILFCFKFALGPHIKTAYSSSKSEQDLTGKQCII